MKKTSARKGVDRRKKKRTSNSTVPAKEANVCRFCMTLLDGDSAKDAQALFVEEEVGRIFCSELCISSFFAPEVERLEKEYFKHLDPRDLSPRERNSFAHLRWITLQEPDEVWCEKTGAGDHRYTVISRFHPNDQQIWYICICLYLRGEPSFLFLAFPTRDENLVNSYRKGERMTQVKKNGDVDSSSERGPSRGSSDETKIDRLAANWTEDETFRAQILQDRSPDDIPVEEFPVYQSCLEETLESPDEVWSLRFGGVNTPKVYQFIRRYPDEDKGGIWYIIVARELFDEDQIEILDAFPTRDAALAERYRRGHQEVGHETRQVGRTIH